ncbi:MAG: DNA/RNA nuclease SfsA [Gemmobacter sp.]|nr:DNA/RNA nuclease SfsA [Gemmobacter sp.]
MRFQTPLVRATLIRRYKRFLADMVLADGTEVTAHCANPGAMTGMAHPGADCWLEYVPDPKRKLRWSWRLVESGGLAVVDTGLANRVVAEALLQGLPDLPHDQFRAEVTITPGTRVDFVLTDRQGDTLVEVKSVTLARNGWSEFPDSVTARGTRHLQELTTAAQTGQRAVMLYLLARENPQRIRIAGDIDPAYAAAFDVARAAGVRMIGLGTAITVHGVSAAAPVPLDDLPQAIGASDKTESHAARPGYGQHSKS